MCWYHTPYYCWLYIYRPPWFDLSQFNELLNKTLDLLNKNHYVFLLGDFNVDITQGVETNLAMEEFKNTFSTHYFYPLINKPTREVQNPSLTTYFLMYHML